MVRFQVGPNNLNTSNLFVDWPNNSFQGVCQNSITASLVSAMNSTVQNCGLFMEPIAGVLPAGKEVLLVTSTDFCTGAHSWAGLSDTVYVIFQCSGNYQGHFANYGSGLRTLAMSFGSGCSDQVTYDRSLLVNQAGFPGAQDGGRVDFNWNGVASYDNDGCNAPVTPQLVNAGNNQTICAGSSINLSANVQGSFTSFQWSGGNGTWTNANQTNATYQSLPSENGNINLTFSATNCNGTVTDQLVLNVISAPTISITPSDTIEICEGETILLTANGSGNIVWNNGATTQTITVSNEGTYTVTNSNNCGSSTATVTVIFGGALPIAAITANPSAQGCEGESIFLNVSSNQNIIWSTGETQSMIEVNSAGTYSVVVSNSCGTDTASINITYISLPDISILEGDMISLCEGESTVIAASSSQNIVWNNGSNNPTISINSPGIYYVVQQNQCGSDTAFVTLSIVPSPIASFTASPTSGIVPLTVSTQNNSIGANQYFWNFGNGSNSNDFEPQFTFNAPGEYIVSLIAENNIGCTDQDTVMIIVNPCPYEITLPNTMSDNNDGLNDNINWSGNCIANITTTIYNRWGICVFTSHSLSDNFTGDGLAEGVYMYIISTTDLNGTPHQHKGFIHLFK